MEKKIDLRVEKTYLALYNAFTFLLEEKRFEDITLNELCDRAMIRRTTFYKHFADKYEYLSFYMKETSASLRDQLPPDIINDNSLDYILYMCRELLRFIEKHKKMVKNIMSSNMFPVLINCLAEQISLDMLHALKKMPVSQNMNNIQMEDIAAFYAGGIVNLLRLHLNRGYEIDENTFIASVAKFLNSNLWT